MNDFEIRKILKQKSSSHFWFEEFTIKHCRIDLYNFSKGIAYEIKSKEDTLNRLPWQLEEYYQVFKRLYIVSDCLKKIKEIERMLKGYPNTGLLFIKDKSIKTIKKHTDNLDIKTMTFSHQDRILLKIMKEDPTRMLIFIKKQFYEDLTEEKRQKYMTIKF